MMTNYILDTNIVAAIVRENPKIIKRLSEANLTHSIFLGCPIVYYEAQKGFLARDAKKQMTRFEKLYETFEWQEYTRADWLLAATLWAKRKALGRPIHCSLCYQPPCNPCHPQHPRF